MMHTTIAGNLGDDVEERVTPSGQKVASMRIAVNNRRGGKEETTWWRVTMWGDRFAKLYPYLKKGSGIFVTGRMQTPRIYNDRAGNPQVSMELTAEIIEFSPFGRGGNKTQEAGSAAYPGFSQQVVGNSAPAAGGEQNAFGQSHEPVAAKTFGQGAAEPVDFEDDNIPF